MKGSEWRAEARLVAIKRPASEQGQGWAAGAKDRCARLRTTSKHDQQARHAIAVCTRALQVHFDFWQPAPRRRDQPALRENGELAARSPSPLAPNLGRRRDP